MPKTRRWGSGPPLVVALLLGACVRGPGSDLILEGDRLRGEGRPMEALVMYEEARESGQPDARVDRRQQAAAEEQASRWVVAAESLAARGDLPGAVELLVMGHSRLPDVGQLAPALETQTRALISQADTLVGSGQRAEAWALLSRLAAIYPEAPGLSRSLANLSSDWSMDLLDQARQRERANDLPLALLDWATLASLNPGDPDIATALVDIRRKVLDQLATPSALFVGSLAPSPELAAQVQGLTDTLIDLLGGGRLRVRGLRWEERPFGSAGTSLTLKAVGEFHSNDVVRGPGVYRIPRGEARVPNPDYVEKSNRVELLKARLDQAATTIDQAEQAYPVADAAGRARITVALDEARREHNHISSQLLQAMNQLEGVPTTVEQVQYTELPVDDELHTHRLQVTLLVEVVDLPEGLRLDPFYVSGTGEEVDLYRGGDLARGIPEDPLLFTLPTEELRKRAVESALREVATSLGAVPLKGAQNWLTRARASEAKGEVEVALRAYVCHVLLAPGVLDQQVVEYFNRRGVTRLDLLRGEE